MTICSYQQTEGKLFLQRLFCALILIGTVIYFSLLEHSWYLNHISLHYVVFSVSLAVK